jgi:hypothetical protein
MRRQALLLNIYSFAARFAHRRALSCSAFNLNAQGPSNLLDVVQQKLCSHRRMELMQMRCMPAMKASSCWGEPSTARKRRT